MREKIYSKFTKERQRRFQIETGIWEEDGVRYVEKCALHTEGNIHILNMYQNFKKLGKKHSFLVPCELRNENMLVFSYCKGTGMAERLLALVEERNREALIQAVISFRKFIIEAAWDKGEFGKTPEFEASPEFTDIFGTVGEKLAGEEAIVWGNLDLTFDNVIENNGLFIIDYEWIMPFAVPVDFILYRAVYGFVQKFHESFQYLMSREELLEILGIGPEKCMLFEELNHSFNAYVYGQGEGYQDILKQYEKRTYDFAEVFSADSEWAQVYFDKGKGYSEENSTLVPVKIGPGIQHIRVPLHEASDLKNIRFDPTMQPAVIEIEDIILHTSDRRKAKISNLKASTTLIQGNTYVFLEGDPQIIIQTKKMKLLKELEIRYRILQTINLKKC